MWIFLFSSNLKLHYLQPKTRKSSDETSQTVDNSLKKTSSRASLSKVSSDKDLPAALTDNDGIKTTDDEQQKVNNNVFVSDVPDSLSSLSDQPKHDTVYDEDTLTTINREAGPPVFNGDLVNGATSKSGEGISSAPVSLDKSEAEKSRPTGSGQDVLSNDVESEMMINREESQPLNLDTPSKVNSPKFSDLKIMPQLDENKNQEHKYVTSPKKVQDQLDPPKKIQDEPGSPKKVQDQPGSPGKVQDDLDEVNCSQVASFFWILCYL